MADEETSAGDVYAAAEFFYDENGPGVIPAGLLEIFTAKFMEAVEELPEEDVDGGETLRDTFVRLQAIAYLAALYDQPNEPYPDAVLRISDEDVVQLFRGLLASKGAAATVRLVVGEGE